MGTQLFRSNFVLAQKMHSVIKAQKVLKFLMPFSFINKYLKVMYITVTDGEERGSGYGTQSQIRIRGLSLCILSNSHMHNPAQLFTIEDD